MKTMTFDTPRDGQQTHDIYISPKTGGFLIPLDLLYSFNVDTMAFGIDLDKPWLITRNPSPKIDMEGYKLPYYDSTQFFPAQRSSNRILEILKQEDWSDDLDYILFGVNQEHDAKELLEKEAKKNPKPLTPVVVKHAATIPEESAIFHTHVVTPDEVIRTLLIKGSTMGELMQATNLSERAVTARMKKFDPRTVKIFKL